MLNYTQAALENMGLRILNEQFPVAVGFLWKLRKRKKMYMWGRSFQVCVKRGKLVRVLVHT